MQPKNNPQSKRKKFKKPPTSSSSSRTSSKHSVIQLDQIDEKLEDLIENKTKKEIVKLSDALKNSEKYIEIGAQIPKGVILTGIDESDKEIFIKTLANETKRKIVKIDLLNVVDKYDDITKGYSRILDSVFQKFARLDKSVLILIENLIFNAEDFHSIAAKCLIKVIKQLLDEIFRYNKYSFVILDSTFIDDGEEEETGPATISADFEAMISQPKRLINSIHLEAPNFKERLELIKKFTENLKTDDKITKTIENLAERTEGFKTNTIRRIVNDAALKAVQKDLSIVDSESFENAFKDFIGEDIYFYDFGDYIKIKDTPIGTVNSLYAVDNCYGGNDLIETVCVRFETKEGKFGSIHATGQLEKNLQESVTIAHSFVQSFCLKKSEEGIQKFKKAHDFLQKAYIHLNLPGADAPTDGSSAGINIATAILSLALKEPVKSGLNMTGEISLNGRVLPVGGIAQKILAAKRSGVKKVIIPEFNKRDLQDLSEDVKDGLEICFVEKYEDVFEIAF